MARLNETLDKVLQIPGAQEHIAQRVGAPPPNSDERIRQLELSNAREKAQRIYGIDDATWEANKILLDGDTPDQLTQRAAAFYAVRAQTPAAPAPAGGTAPAPAPGTPAQPGTPAPAAPAPSTPPQSAQPTQPKSLEQLRAEALAVGATRKS